MTWEELKEKAKEMGYADNGNYFGDIIVEFDEDGTIWVEGSKLASNRTYDQMLAIMKALQ